MLSKINRYNCKITQNGVELHNKDYISLKDISNELGLSYHIVANISIEIIRLELDYNEIEKEKKDRKSNNTEDY